MATMADVARAAGVSIQTVSAVVNDKPGISTQTRERVLQVIMELDFHPNFLASSLRSQRTLTIGILVGSITNPYFPEIVRGAEDVAHRNGYSVFLCNTDGDPEKRLAYLRTLRRHRVAGLITTEDASTPDEQRVVEHLIARGLPVVRTGAEQTSTDRIVTISVDDRSGEYTATTHLLDLGHRRIGIITGPGGRRVSTERLAGYEDALRDRSLPIDPALIAPGGFAVANGQAGVYSLMGLHPPPTAIVAANDLVAIGAITTLKRMGKRVPEDVAVIGYDNIGLAGLYDPPLTTIAQPLHEMGSRAMQAIIDRVHDPEMGGAFIKLDTQLIVRHSTVPSGASP